MGTTTNLSERWVKSQDFLSIEPSHSENPYDKALTENVNGGF